MKGLSRLEKFAKWVALVCFIACVASLLAFIWAEDRLSQTPKRMVASFFVVGFVSAATAGTAMGLRGAREAARIANEKLAEEEGDPLE